MVIIIAALSKNRVIGKDNKLPWHISDELRKFKQLTTGHTVIMGRKTFESLGKPLPNRNNIVISHSLSPRPAVSVCRDLDEALQKAHSFNRDIYIIGGAALFEQALPRADRMYISHVKKEYDGDTYFPKFNPCDWKVEEVEDYPEFEFVVYARKQ